MRDILFRGKRIDNGEWLEGYYMNLGNKYHYILSGKLDIAYGCLDLVKYPISPETVGQYTGLKDKNGKRIFEGDIIVYSEDYTYRVFWDNDELSFGVDGINNIDSDRLGNLYGVSCEVIGNIHDNPELLDVT